jgi:hypothetical protein
LSTVEAKYLSDVPCSQRSTPVSKFSTGNCGKGFLIFPQNIFANNQGAIALEKNYVTSECNKYIELRHFFLGRKLKTSY